MQVILDLPDWVSEADELPLGSHYDIGIVELMPDRLYHLRLYNPVDTSQFSERQLVALYGDSSEICYSDIYIEELELHPAEETAMHFNSTRQT